METGFPCNWVLNLGWDISNQSSECPEKQLYFTLLCKMKKIQNVNRTERIINLEGNFQTGSLISVTHHHRKESPFIFLIYHKKYMNFFLQRPQQQNVFKVIYLPINPHKTHIIAFLLFTQDIQRAVFG